MDDHGVVGGYDRVVENYIAERSLLKSGKYIQKLLKFLSPRSAILDLGCGAGIPVDDILLKDHHTVTGIDISPEMIRRARKNCPGADYIVRDIRDLVKGEYAVDAVVSFYALFHLERSTHHHLIRTMRSYLPQGGYALITLGDRDFEGYTDFYGTRMWWSQWGPEKNRKLMIEAGFTILLDEIDTTGSEKHHVIIARAH